MDDFINKPCVSEQACHEDKMKVLEKIKAEIFNKMESGQWSEPVKYGMRKTIFIIDKYMKEGDADADRD